MKLSKRGQAWTKFAEEVVNHIENYTVPQYGDEPDDNVEEWDSYDCIKQVVKYLNRVKTCQRPGEEKRDLMKMAHYIQLAHQKMDTE